MVLCIKQQLSYVQHPLRRVIDRFKKCFTADHMCFLERFNDSGLSFAEKLDHVNKSLLEMINYFVESVLLFY